MSRDFLQDQGESAHGDPMRKAQAMMRPPLPKRFYKEVTVEHRADERHVVLLDGRTVKTPGRLTLALPEAALADAVAAEWRAQVDVIDPARMHLTRIVNSGLEAVPAKRAEVADAIAAYAGSDLLCYRAEGPDRLVARQAETWDPVLAWADETLGARFILAGGVMPVAQPPATLAAVRDEVGRYSDLGLAALSTATTLSGSVVLALAVARGELEPAAAWSAAHVDEDWNIELWGQDADAMRLRAAKQEEFNAAALVLNAGV